MAKVKKIGLILPLSSALGRALVLAFLLGICVIPSIFPYGALAAQTKKDALYPISIQTGVRAKMRDGVQLVADIYRPKAEGKFPIILQRTPYNRKGEAGMASELASHGYIVVLQDTRGRFDSEGEFYPFRFESQDGYDTVEWAAALEGSNGRVGMFGGSYVGATQMLAAMVEPPHLVAIFPYLTASEYYDGWTYQNGALMQWFTSSWTTTLAPDTLRRKATELARPKQWNEQSPLEKYPVVNLPAVETIAPYYRDWLKHERDDDYWQRWKVSDYYQRMKVKGLHAGGWHDIFLKGSIKNYTGLRDSALSAEARGAQRLIIGPWAHAETSPKGKIGDVVFGKSAVLNMTQTALEWFDYALKDVQNQYATDRPVRIFVMGENVWRAESEFPLARTQYTKYFLHSTQSANSSSGDGVLSTAPPKDERPDAYSYDPRQPVPTIGGRLCCGQELPPGPFDQRPNENRRDVLVFSTDTLERDVEVTGFINVELYASSSASDTDFTALLVDVAPDGYARFLTDGIVRARYRNGTSRPEEIIPGRVYKYNVDLWATSNLFKRGHRIRLYITSSNYPRFNRNFNTGVPVLKLTRLIDAQQTIFHTRQYPSALILPLIPR